MGFFRYVHGAELLAVADAGGEVYLFHHDGRPFVGEAGTQVRIAASARDLVHLPRTSGWPDLVTVSENGVTRAYDIPTGAKRAEWPSPRAEELHVVEAFLEPNGSPTVAVAGMGDIAHLWRGSASAPLALSGHTGPVRALTALRAEHQLAVADERGITIWSLAGGEPVTGPFCSGRSRSLAVLTEHGQVRLASATADGIRLWDPATGAELSHFAHHLNVAAVAVTDAEQDDELLLAAASHNTVTLWSPATEALSRTQLAGVPAGTVTVLARIRAGQGTLLAAGDDRGTVAVWRLVPQQRAANLIGEHDDWVNDLVVVQSEHRRLLASASDDRRVVLWDIGRARRAGDPFGHPTQVQAVTAVDGDLATGDQYGGVRRWTIDGALQWERESPHGVVQAMASFRSGDNWWIVSAGAAGHCLVWSADGRVERELRPPTPADPDGPPVPRVRAVAVAELGGAWYVAAGDFGGRIEVWNAETGERQWRLEPAHRTRVMALAMIRVGGRVLLASGGGAGSIRLWDLATGEKVGETVGGHSGAVAALCAVRDGPACWLASGGQDHSVRLWDPAAIERPISEVLDAHDSWVRTLTQVAGAEPTQLASGGEDGAIRLWQVKDGQLVRRTHGPSIRGFRDRLAKVDLLNREAILTELHAMLRPDRADPYPSDGEFRDRPSGPQVVLIDGAWGTGKSSLMRDLRDLLEDGQVSAGSSPGWWDWWFTPWGGVRWLGRWVRRRWHWRELSPRRVIQLAKAGAAPRMKRRSGGHSVTAWFNPWAHESSEQVWSGLAWTIIDATRDRLGASQADRQRYWLGRNIPRLDRGALRRTIRLRIWRPTLATLAVLIVPLAMSMVRLGVADTGGPTMAEFDPRDFDLGELAVVDALPLGIGAAVLLVLLILFCYAVWQYFFGRATAHLPADVFEGPIDHASMATVAGEPLVRDPPYLSAAGQLYRVNQDLHRLTQDLEELGYQLVVLIDDLDRCTPRRTAEVFEAINAFLSDQNFRDSAPRFVIGLDQAVVAGRLAAAYTESGSAVPASDVDDPNCGWSILRKLSQLTVVLPGIHSTHTARLLRQHSADRTGSPDRFRPEPATPPLRTVQLPRRRVKFEDPPTAGPNHHQHDHCASTGQRARRPSLAPPEPQFVPLESEPDVQKHLRALIALRQRQSMRETKRLLTLWSFYMRLLDRLLPPGSIANVQDACDVLTLAETVRRWPALGSAMGRVGDGPSGLAVLVRAARAGSGDPAWRSALERVGLSGDDYQTMTAHLRQLLQAHGNETVAAFADSLL
jgi:WD40 repeat protein